MTRGLAYAAFFCMLVTVAGCGGGKTDAAAVHDAVADYLSALADRDTVRACADLTSKARIELFAAAFRERPQAILELVNVPSDEPAACSAILDLLFENVSQASLDQLRFAEVKQVSFDHGTAYVRIEVIDTPTLLRFGATQIPRLVRSEGKWLIDSLGIDLPGGAAATIARTRTALAARAAARRQAKEMTRAHGIAVDLGNLYDEMVKDGADPTAAVVEVNRDVIEALATFSDAKARFSLASGVLAWERGILGADSPVIARFAERLAAKVPAVAASIRRDGRTAARPPDSAASER